MRCRQILFLFWVLFFYRSACYTLTFIFNQQKPQAPNACGFYFCPADFETHPAKEKVINQIYDVNVEEFNPLISPAAIKKELEVTDETAKTVIQGRRDI